MDTRQLSPAEFSAAEVIALLDLAPLEPEGGYFRRMAEGPADAVGGRRTYALIYFLVTPDGFSALHRLAIDEMWCFLAGDPVEMLQLLPDGTGHWTGLGLRAVKGDVPAGVVPAGTWQGTQLVAGGRWALVAATTVPGFEWEDFELGNREELAGLYPGFAPAIAGLTR